jgi:hypothetical protein
MPLANIAASFVQEGKARDAVEAADQSFALLAKWHGDPAAASRAKHIASVSKAFGCLALGRWADGWEYAESLYGDTLSPFGSTETRKNRPGTAARARRL